MRGRDQGTGSSSMKSPGWIMQMDASRRVMGKNELSRWIWQVNSNLRLIISGAVPDYLN